MDKELLRIVIIASGFLVILGMIFWNYFKNHRLLADDNFEDEPVLGSSGNMDDSLKLHTDRDDFDIVPIGSAKRSSSHYDDEDMDNDDDWNPEYHLDDEGDDADYDADERIDIPEIIQFGVVADADEGFNGVDLALAFQSVGLKYGDLKVYERVNDDGGIDFGVACMVEPGTFPEEGQDLMAFNCPGVVFYLQHMNFQDARPIFDDFVETIETVAKDLNGVIWDHQRQPLTEATIQAIRHSL